MGKEYQEIGCIKNIFIYPVKSMKGVTVEQAKIGWQGFAGDRRFAYLRVGIKTGLPWLSVRNFPKLILYTARFSDLENIDRSPIIVTNPDNKEYMLHDTELTNEISRLSNTSIELVQLWRGTYDSMPISLISLTSIRYFEEALNRRLELERFRPNIVIDYYGEKKFPEEKLTGKTLVIGDSNNPARIKLYRKDPRCMVVNLDPETAQQDPRILKEIVKQRKNFLGAYGNTDRPGLINIGDKIYLVK